MKRIMVMTITLNSILFNTNFVMGMVLKYKSVTKVE
jgi:hypothetical protein